VTAPSRRAANLEERSIRYAIAFDLNWKMDCHQPCDGEPTDANLAKVLAYCARPPRPGEYPAIRQYVLEARAAEHDAAPAPLTRTERHNDATYRWVVSGPRGSAEFTMNREGGSIAVCYHDADPAGTDACELLPAGTCTFERDLAGGQLMLFAWQQNDNGSLWDLLEDLYAERYLPKVEDL
jgi:hypothetical protein